MGCYDKFYCNPCSCYSCFGPLNKDCPIYGTGFLETTTSPLTPVVGSPIAFSGTGPNSYIAPVTPVSTGRLVIPYSGTYSIEYMISAGLVEGKMQASAFINGVQIHRSDSSVLGASNVTEEEIAIDGMLSGKFYYGLRAGDIVDTRIFFLSGDVITPYIYNYTLTIEKIG